jgi:hypothetical protein
MISDEEIDEALLRNITEEWRKMLFVVGTTFLQIDDKLRDGCDDS